LHVRQRLGVCLSSAHLPLQLPMLGLEGQRSGG
jgi:hypothetical protein